MARKLQVTFELSDDLDTDQFVEWLKNECQIGNEARLEPEVTVLDHAEVVAMGEVSDED